MLGVDDGIVNGNFDFADILFIAAAILAVVAAYLYSQVNAAHLHRHAPVALSIALACIAVGWFVL